MFLNILHIIAHLSMYERMEELLGENIQMIQTL